MLTQQDLQVNASPICSGYKWSRGLSYYSSTHAAPVLRRLLRCSRHSGFGHQHKKGCKSQYLEEVPQLYSKFCFNQC